MPRLDDGYERGSFNDADVMRVVMGSTELAATPTRYARFRRYSKVDVTRIRAPANCEMSCPLATTQLFGLVKPEVNC